MFPQPQQNNATRILGNQMSDIQLKTQDASQISGWGYPVPLTWNNAPSHGQPTQRRNAMPGAYQQPTPQVFYPPDRLSASSDVASMSSAGSPCAEIASSENTPELQVSDEVFAQIAVDITAFGLRLRERREGEANLVPHKRHGLTPDLGGEPSGWKIERGDPSVADQGDARHMGKRRRTMESEQTGVRPAPQMGSETRGLPVRGTPIPKEDRSKLGRRGLNMEIPVALPQGVYPPFELGPTITGRAPESYEYESQAWTKGEERGSDFREVVGIEDAHDERESDKERWARLMLNENGEWKCRGCGGQVFSDRSTLQRHCRSEVHGKQRDRRKCPLCPNLYRRQSGVKRHMEAKHPGWRAKGGGA